MVQVHPSEPRQALEDFEISKVSGLSEMICSDKEDGSGDAASGTESSQPCHEIPRELGPRTPPPHSRLKKEDSKKKLLKREDIRALHFQRATSLFVLWPFSKAPTQQM